MSKPRLVGLVASLNDMQAAYLEPELKALGLTWSTFQLLSVVKSSKLPMHQAQLAEELGVTPATLSEALNFTIRKGWITRTPDPADKRLKRIALTSQAEEMLAKVLHASERCERVATAGLSVNEIKQVAQVLQRMAQQLARGIEDQNS